MRHNNRIHSVQNETRSQKWYEMHIACVFRRTTK